MQSEFKREERYIVVKLKHLRDAQGGAFPDNKIHGLLNYLSATGVEPLEGAAVIESDWPEHDLVWRMIEARMTTNAETEEHRALGGEVVGLIVRDLCETEPDDSPNTVHVGLPELGAILTAHVIPIVAAYLSAARREHVLRQQLAGVSHERDNFKAAYVEWSDKTDWLHKSVHVSELGKHRADVMKDRLDAAESLIQQLKDIVNEREEGYAAHLNGNSLNISCMNKVSALVDSFGKPAPSASQEVPSKLLDAI
jgi:hypothetical protein